MHDGIAIAFSPRPGRELPVDYLLLAAFLIYRQHSLVRVEPDGGGRPRFVFLNGSEIQADICDFQKGDPAVPCRTLARIMGGGADGRTTNARYLQNPEGRG